MCLAGNSKTSKRYHFDMHYCAGMGYILNPVLGQKGTNPAVRLNEPRKGLDLATRHFELKQMVGFVPF